MERRRRHRRRSVPPQSIYIKNLTSCFWYAATTTYYAISRTIRYLSDRSEPPRPTPASLFLTFPTTSAQILASFRAKIREIKRANPNVDYSDAPPDTAGARNPGANKIVAVIDSISSNPGMALPWKELVQICKEEGVWSLIDGAHSVGQEVRASLAMQICVVVTVGLDSPLT